MRGGSSVFILFVLAFIAVVDAYSFRGIRILSGNLEQWLKILIHIAYWLIPVTLVAIIVYLGVNSKDIASPEKFRVWYMMMGYFVLFYVPKLVFIIFQLGNDLVQLTGFIITKASGAESGLGQTGAAMSRAEFLTKAGIIVAAIPFVSIINGIARGRYNYKIKNVDLAYNNLPEAFNGFRILQVSDWHIGSFIGQQKKVQEAVDLINAQHADLVLFTGDMVNNLADEMLDFIPILGKINAKYGKYSILGNHDYGEYVSWENEEAHHKNMHRLYDYHKQAGFTLLRNQSFQIEVSGERIGVAGVENWGLPPFPQYGDLKLATAGIEDLPFKILMSHDPSHWDAEVREKSDIDLTLSGHTHGMQFGINIPGLKWSPVKWKYPRWSGLYTEGKQNLYVNVGIGYIGFPGRVGFLPELTVFELHKSQTG